MIEFEVPGFGLLPAIAQALDAAGVDGCLHTPSEPDFDAMS
jgi:hypothetical protein